MPKKKKVVYRGTGRRKNAVARVRVYPGKGNFDIGGEKLETYFPRRSLCRMVKEPLEVVGMTDKFDIVADVFGGGVSGQAGAIRHGISRALVEVNESFRDELKRFGLLTRDQRMKERRKYGLKKARKRPQFSKR